MKILFLDQSFAKQVIAVSQAAKKAFIAAGERAEIIDMVYNGFKPEEFKVYDRDRTFFRQQLGVDDKFVVGHGRSLLIKKIKFNLILQKQKCCDSVLKSFQ